MFKRLNKKTIKKVYEEDIKFTKNSVKFYIKNKSVFSFYFVNRNKQEINYIPISYEGLWTIAEIDIRTIDKYGYTDFFYQIGNFGLTKK